jgi:pimeloyl-ACP methyl ester carboxylesterase
MVRSVGSVLVFCLCFVFVSQAVAQAVKRLPPPGIQIDDQARSKLTKRVKTLRETLKGLVQKSADSDSWYPDGEVLIRAVDMALRFNGFYKEKQLAVAADLLNEAERRISAIGKNKLGWELLAAKGITSTEPTLIVGGFKSRIDDSVQPYGLVLPANFDPNQMYRLDVWLHGRGDTKQELVFLNERMTKVGQYAPENTIVLHPFGRHCNAYKFAGETDVFEAIEHISGLAKIDRRRISMRGFSMGGAGVWHLAVHHPTKWFAVNPGAGFVDTIVYQGWDKEPPFEITPSRERLLKLYDVLPWAANLQNTNLIAYSGEVDRQRQAAERVFAEGKKLGFDWTHVIGKDMGHKIDPESAAKIDSTLADWADQVGQSPRKEIKLETYTLRYADANWLAITGLKEHWQRSQVDARITESNSLKITTHGVTHLDLDFADSGWPGKKEVGLNIDGERFYITDTGDTDGMQCQLVRTEQWNQVVGESTDKRKRPGLQGPIDDAFYDRFLFVVPTRPSANGVVERWVKREIEYAQSRWQRLMRGNVRVVKDTELTDQQIADNHLICFGDFLGNQFLGRVSHRLPIVWTRDELKFNGKTYDPATHAAVMCYPNPENPNRYLVMNSGMTFREFSNVSNSRQIAMLPDWAILKVDDEFDDHIFAGDVIDQGFFDEQWDLR